MKKGLVFIICLGLLLSLPGCSVQKNSIGKVRDLPFHVLGEEDIPEELKAKIAKKKAQPFKITYSDKGYLYIAEGYGEKETNGYSVEVTSCYESDNAIYIHTNLIGPSKEEKVIRKPANPQVVVKLDAIDKNVVFE